ncbi:hypothetical protein [Rhodococcus pyridinivorans]|uniref:hypothetical protein n=1 Tax=Rhodococcus pyridinivorans TaxID=103816 RepID=UPI002078A71F|nr:hypothetical protein [Rhodococcus pyridinivorans]USI90467.1 hypothetical protein LLA01_00445 [Rhodococcus pyridinivorans]
MLHIVVEGDDFDPAYYGKIASWSKNFAQSFNIIRAQEYKSSRGKTGVLQLFEETQKSESFAQETSQGKRFTIFMVDSDTQILFGGQIDHPHLFYTTGYDVESDILRHASDKEALVNLLQISPVESADLVAELGDWIDHSAKVWAEWLVLCCVSHTIGLDCQARFEKNPKLRKRDSPELHPKDLENAWEDLRLRSGFSDDEILKLEGQIREKLDSVFNAENGGRIVKGKWLPQYLTRRLREILSLKGISRPKLAENQVLIAYLGALNPEDRWAREYVARLDSLPSESISN